MAYGKQRTSSSTANTTIVAVVASFVTMWSVAAAFVQKAALARHGLSSSSLLPLTSRAVTTAIQSHSNALFMSSPSAFSVASRHRFSGPLFMSADDDDDDDNSSAKTLDRTWQLNGLKKEVARLTMRAHKKVGKASQRLQKANDEVDRLTSDPDVSMEELEKCPNVEELEQDLEQVRDRLVKLNQLELFLGDIKGKAVVLPDHVASLAMELEVDDAPPQRQERPPKKEKGPRVMQSFRLPYRRFYSKNNVEIRVGKQAEDNDELSCSPKHRDGADWWMHASGCPGSHVVIRCHDQNLDDEVVQDAAALAARQSKCSGQVIKVSMTRARDVKKPPGAKAGLVQLTGQVRTISVNMKKAEERLARLDATVLVN